ncbi:MAG: prepilin-type N-terminal cleavage/methylation domain-containing protein [Bacillota bacterium]|nr:prepilin-type N-terminal cleavage/methylation domain-containing protein [Bacillota bacterium]
MKRKNRGFTLSEVLLVIAILAILMAVAIPGVIALRKNLKMMELDDTAREIFLAAQNNLTARKAAGTLDTWGLESPEDSSCFWLSKNDAASILPAGSIEGQVAGGDYVVWYNADSATVLEVYYTETNRTMPALEVLETMVYSDKYDKQSDNSQNQGQDPDTRTPKERRRDAWVGYYCGEDLERSNTDQLLPPFLEIENGDDLIVKVTVQNAAAYIMQGVELIVTVDELDADGNVVAGKQKTFSGGDTGYNNVDGTWTKTLDSLTDRDKAFKTICSGITPGANIRVTAKLSAPDRDGVRFLSSSASQDTSSLFADRIVTEDDKDTVSIACARHLQNLDLSYSMVNEEIELADCSFQSKGGKLYVEQTADIQWPSGLEYQSINSYTGEIAGFNGNSLKIENLKGSNGLFAYADNCALKNINIVNPKITSYTLTTGGLVGFAVGSSGAMEIDNCRVFCSSYLENGQEDIASYQNYSIVNSTKGNTGGLIGNGQNVAISNSFSSLYCIVGGGNTGGLAGALDGNCTVSNSYAVVDQLSGTDKIGMFVGYFNSGASVTGCYAVGNISATSGAISGFANGYAAIANSYCAVTYNTEDGTPTGVNPAYGFASGGNNTCAYLSGSFTPTAGSETDMEKNYEELRNWGIGFASVSEENSHPYREKLAGKAYPFRGVATLPHYGSWPEQTVGDIKIFDGMDPNSSELKYILIPKNRQNITVYAIANLGSDNQEITVKGSGKSDIIIQKEIITEYNSKTGYTTISITSKENSIGTTYLDLTAGGKTLRVVVVVYEVEVTLTGETASSHQNTTVKVTQENPSESRDLSPWPANEVGEFTASLTRISPVKKRILNELNGMKDSSKTLSATAEDFKNWDQLKSGDPAVTANGDPDGNILASATDGNGKLTVTGVASGTATVSARWAMDEGIEAKINVNVTDPLTLSSVPLAVNNN